MKRLLVGLLAVSMLVLAACGGSQSQPPGGSTSQGGTPQGGTPQGGTSAGSSSSGPSTSAGDKVIKIGLIAPLTGSVKTFGESSQKGFLLALEQAGYKAGDFKIEYVSGDDKGDSTEGVNLATRFITQDGVKAIVGSVTSGVTIPVSRIANENKIPMITGTATAEGVTVEEDGTRKPFIFRACFIDPFQGQVAARFALQELGVKTAAVFYDRGNPYTVGLAESFRAEFEAGGGQIVAWQAYTEADTDFSAVMTNVAALKPDMLYLPDYYNKVSLLAKAARDKGLGDVPMLGGDGWDSEDLDFEALAGNYFTAHYSADDPSPAVQKFVQEFEAKYGHKPDSFAALTYDATNILLEAIRVANTDDTDAIRQAMQDLKGFQAVGGSISFDEKGNPIKAATILKVSADKTYEFVTTVNP
ncbi:ABC transporter substrate-binding protein [Symbiobacterium thermophilum]|uniref:ABC transporter substrate-binding protein n=1 Tax=Symbiobacterium thermophilum TaxID=2734 RepID=UPI0035C7482E